jgi:cell division FtsZ-interacting protein ZapD
MAVSQGTAFAREEVKVSMEDVLKELNKMRRELRELKIQRDRDQRVIEELRQIVENGIPADLPATPQPAVAAPSAARPVPPPMPPAE